MTHPVPAACTLSCDRCHASFLFNGNNVFGSAEDARARASVLGWLHAGGHDYCPRCKDKKPRRSLPKPDNKNARR